MLDHKETVFDGAVDHEPAISRQNGNVLLMGKSYWARFVFKDAKTNSRFNQVRFYVNLNYPLCVDFSKSSLGLAGGHLL